MNEKRRIKEMTSGLARKWNYGDFMKKVIVLAIGVLSGIAVALAVSQYIFMAAVIRSADMEGTISSGDVVLGTRFDIDEENIERYDILLFTPLDDPEKIYLKRVIGLPGETIEVRDGEVYADGIRLDDSFVSHPMNRRGDGVYEIPEGCYFVLGDNRNNSIDSRFWDEKYVPFENIQAKARVALSSFFDMCWL